MTKIISPYDLPHRRNLMSDLILSKNLKYKNMKTNQGLGDRVLRIYLGIIIAGIGIYFNTIWAVIGIPVFVSGIVGTCPLYSMLKLNTINKEERELA